MNLTSSSSELNGTLKELRLRWEETTAIWNDPVRQDFQEHQWQPLQERVLAALRAMDRLAPVLEKVRHECG
jgi:hypothetical protein